MEASLSALTPTLDENEFNTRGLSQPSKPQASHFKSKMKPHHFSHILLFLFSLESFPEPCTSPERCLKNATAEPAESTPHATPQNGTR